jgi:transposase
MLYTGLDLSRKRLDVHVLSKTGETVEITQAPPDADGLRGLVQRMGRHGEPITAAIESMNGARFVHDQLELAGWTVDLADAKKVKGLAPLACKTDKIDAWVLAELCRRDLVPAIWLPSPEVRGARERARWRLHLVRHRVALKNRIHSALMTFGHPCPVSDLFGVEGRRRLDALALPEPWAGDVRAALRLIDELDRDIDACEAELRRIGTDHAYVPLLKTVPGIGDILGYTIAAELGDISRFASPRSSVATPACARASTSPATRITAARCRRRARSTCAGRSSRRPFTPHGTPGITTTTRRPRSASANSAAARSRGLNLPVPSAKPSGTCSPSVRDSVRQAPPLLWSRDDPPRDGLPDTRSHRPDPPSRRR